MSGHVVMVIDARAPLAPVLACVRRLVPELSQLHVVSLNGDPEQSLEDVFATLAPTGMELSVEASFDAAQVAHAAHERNASLVVVGPWPSLSARERALAVLQLVARYDVNVLAVSGRCGDEAVSRHAGLVLDPRSAALAETAAAVRALPHVVNLTLLLRAAWTEADETRLRALFPTHELELVSMTEIDPLAIADAAAARGAELLVVPSVDVSAATLMSSIFSGRVLEDVPLPVLLLHHDATSTGLFGEKLWGTDVVRTGRRPLRVLLERSTPLGRSALLEGERFFLVGAEAMGELPHARGVVEVPDAWLAPDAVALALCPVKTPTTVASVRILGAGSRRDPSPGLPEPVEDGRTEVSLAGPSSTGSDRPGRGVTSSQRPIVLLDSRVDQLTDVEAFAADHEIIVVRLRADEPLETVRARFDATAPWGGPVPVLDASALLDDAGAADVPTSVDALRMQRLGLLFQVEGVPAVASVMLEAPELSSPVFATWTPAQLAARSPTHALSPRPPPVEDEDARWRRLTGASLVEGHRLELEFENEAARKRLLASIAAAKERVHWQSFMVDNDPVSEEVAEALRQAGARGVQVRVLVDALYSLHDVFGAKNPVLTKLAESPGVEVRAAHVLSGLPGVIALKRRNHRKLTCIDRRLATVSGRNLGAPYYRGFGELNVTAQTSYHDVPWFDAGVVIEGPLVEAIERAFLADWVEAGGAAFEVSPCPPAGKLACRLVLHAGLRDTHGLDAQLELIRSAKTRVVMVNTFPLVLELQQALVAAVRRGVRVQCLVGSVRPVWGDDTPFVGGALRALADELVRARLTPVLQAGGEAFLHAVPVAGLGPVFTHVHAKLFVRDDDLVFIGSANTDVTSAYWESEANLLVHDPGFAREVLRELEALMARARPVDAGSARFREVQARREWLSRNWPSIIP